MPIKNEYQTWNWVIPMSNDKPKDRPKTGPGRWDFNGFYQRPVEEEFKPGTSIPSENDPFVKAYLNVRQALAGSGSAEPSVAAPPQELRAATASFIGAEEKQGKFYLDGKKVNLTAYAFDCQGDEEETVTTAVQLLRPFKSVLEEKMEAVLGPFDQITAQYFKKAQVTFNELQDTVSIPLLACLDVAVADEYQAMVIPLDEKGERALYQVTSPEEEKPRAAGLLYKDKQGKIQLHEIISLTKP